MHISILRPVSAARDWEGSAHSAMCNACAVSSKMTFLNLPAKMLPDIGISLSVGKLQLPNSSSTFRYAVERKDAACTSEPCQVLCTRGSRMCTRWQLTSSTDFRFRAAPLRKSGPTCRPIPAITIVTAVAATKVIKQSQQSQQSVTATKVIKQSGNHKVTAVNQSSNHNTKTAIRQCACSHTPPTTWMQCLVSSVCVFR